MMMFRKAIVLGSSINNMAKHDCLNKTKAWPPFKLHTSWRWSIWKPNTNLPVPSSPRACDCKCNHVLLVWVVQSPVPSAVWKHGWDRACVYDGQLEVKATKWAIYKSCLHLHLSSWEYFQRGPNRQNSCNSSGLLVYTYMYTYVTAVILPTCTSLYLSTDNLGTSLQDQVCITRQHITWCIIKHKLTVRTNHWQFQCVRSWTAVKITSKIEAELGDCKVSGAPLQPFFHCMFCCHGGIPVKTFR